MAETITINEFMSKKPAELAAIQSLRFLAEPGEVLLLDEFISDSHFMQFCQQLSICDGVIDIDFSGSLVNLSDSHWQILATALAKIKSLKSINLSSNQLFYHKQFAIRTVIEFLNTLSLPLDVNLSGNIDEDENLSEQINKLSCLIASCPIIRSYKLGRSYLGKYSLLTGSGWKIFCDAIAKSSNLEGLNLEDNQLFEVSENNWLMLAIGLQGTKLHTLGLADNQLSFIAGDQHLAIIALISGLPMLQNLDLAFNTYSEEEEEDEDVMPPQSLFEIACSCPQLKRLNLSGNCFDSEIFANQLPQQLCSLQISNFDTQDTGFRQVRKLFSNCLDLEHFALQELHYFEIPNNQEGFYERAHATRKSLRRIINGLSACERIKSISLDLVQLDNATNQDFWNKFLQLIVKKFNFLRNIEVKSELAKPALLTLYESPNTLLVNIAIPEVSAAAIYNRRVLLAFYASMAFSFMQAGINYEAGTILQKLLDMLDSPDRKIFTLMLLKPKNEFVNFSAYDPRLHNDPSLKLIRCEPLIWHKLRGAGVSATTTSTTCSRDSKRKRPSIY